MKVRLAPTFNKGFSLIEILLVLTGIIAICITLWYISGPPHKDKVTTTDPNKQIIEIDSLLITVGIGKLDNWYLSADCGPTDAFEGYSLRHDTKEISPKQAKELKSAATKANLRVIKSTPGPNPASYTIKKNDWDIQITTYTNELNFSLAASIRMKEKIGGFPYKGSFCG